MTGRAAPWTRAGPSSYSGGYRRCRWRHGQRRCQPGGRAAARGSAQRGDPGGEGGRAGEGALPRGPFEFAADAPALDISPTAASEEAVTARLRMTGNNGVDARLALNDISGNSGNLAIAQAKLAAEIKQRRPRLECQRRLAHDAWICASARVRCRRWPARLPSPAPACRGRHAYPLHRHGARRACRANRRSLRWMRNWTRASWR